MRKLLFILGCLISFLSQGQTIQFLGSPTTQIYVRGQMRVDTVFYLPLRDTNFTPAQVGAVIVKSSNQTPYVWTGTKWSLFVVGSINWGDIHGTLSNQTDLQAALNAKQGTIIAGYGIKETGSTLTFDSANVRKVDTLIRTNDSTLTYAINGVSRSILIRGSAGGGISSLVLTVPTGIFNSPVTFTGAPAWAATLTLLTQSAGTFLSGPSTGGAATPTFRAMTTADLPTGIPNGNLANPSINLTTGGSGSIPNWSTASVTLGGTATINIPTTSGANTGIVTPAMFNFWNAKVDSTLQSNDSVYEFRNGTRFFRYLISAAGSGLTSLNGLTASVQTLAIGSAGTAPAWASSGSTHTLNIPFAASSSVTLGGISNADYVSFSKGHPRAPLGSLQFNSAGVFSGNASFLVDTVHKVLSADSLTWYYSNIANDPAQARRIQIHTTQGDTVTGTRPYGQFWHTLDQSFTNPDGQIDAVYQWGYNQNGNGSTVNNNGPEVHFAIESHFQQGGVGDGQMEIHLQSKAKNGDINRAFSYDIQEDNGQTGFFQQVDNFSLQGTAQSGVGEYVHIANDGTFSISGTSPAIDVGNTTSGDGVQIVPIPGFGAGINVSNPSTITNGIGFGSSIALVPNNVYAIDIRSSNSGVSTSNNIGLQWSGDKTDPYTIFSTGSFTSYDGGMAGVMQNASTSTNAFALLQIGAKKTGTMNIPMIAFQNAASGTDWVLGSPQDDSWKLQFNTSFNYLTGTAAISATNTNQVGVNTNTADPSAALDVVSTGAGVLIPRLSTSQQNAISSPATGLTIWNTDSLDLCVFTGTEWLKERAPSAGGVPGGSSNDIQMNNAGTFYGDGNFTRDISTGAVSIGGAAADMLSIISANSTRATINLQATDPVAQGTFYLQSDRGSFLSYGGELMGNSSNPGTLFGISRADRFFIIHDGADGLGMAAGTLTATPFTLGTNNAEVLTLTGAGAVTAPFSTFPNQSGADSIFTSTTTAGVVTMGRKALSSLAGVNTVGTFSSSSIANGASISGSTLTLGVGDGTNPGMVSTTTQTIAGTKTFNAAPILTTSSTAGQVWTATNSSGAGGWATAPSGSFWVSTFTNTTNISSSHFFAALYTRIGNFIHVNIDDAQITPSTPLTSAVLTFSLPFTTTQTTAGAVGSGTFALSAFSSILPGVVTITSGTTATFTFTPSSASTFTGNISFDYSL